MWKPGQIITVGGKKYRITKRPSTGYSCYVCDNRDTHECHEPCRTCIHGKRMPYTCYPKEIKPKSVMG